MPKETIKTGNGTYKPTTVHVGWDRSGYVQIATTGWYHGKEDGPEVGVYADLNRNQINSLIRNLRKARDQAFGADE